MSPMQISEPLSDTAAGRRRHARHTTVHWARRASVATGVVGAAVLTSAAAPAGAATSPGAGTPPNEISQTLDLSQLRASQATAQAAVAFQLAASQQAADAAASKAARHHREAERRKAAAKARAAKARRDAAAATPAAVTTSAASAAHGSVATVLAFVKAQLGKAYVMGATGPDAYDCSGLVQAAYRTIGVDLPRVSEAQSTAGTQVSLSDLRPGDILYWGSAGNAYHVAVYIGNGDFIGAQNPSSGVVEHPLSFDEPTGAVRVA